MHALYRTPGGAMVGGGYGALYRYDPAIGEWSEPMSQPGYSWTFGSDSTGDIYAHASPGLLRSTDDGRSWTLIDSVAALAVLEGHSVVLLGSNLRSVDAGATWQRSDLMHVWHAVNMGRGRLFATYADTVYASSDNGRTWRSVRSFPSWIYSINALDSSALFVGTSTQTFRSTDLGATWSADSFATRKIARAGDGSLYASAFAENFSTERDGVYRSVDTGRTWTLVSQALARAIAPGMGAEVWAAFNPHIMSSTDGGSTWTKRVANLYGRTGQLWSQSDGTIFSMLSGHHINADNGGISLFELIRTDDDGTTWVSLLDSVRYFYVLPGEWGIVAIVSTRIGHGSQPSQQLAQRMVLSTNDGRTWSAVGSGFPSFSATDDGRAVATEYIDADTTRFVITADFGATWTRNRVRSGDHSPTVLPSGRILFRRSEFNDSGYTWYLHASDDGGITSRLVLDGSHVVYVTGYGGGVTVAAAVRDASQTWAIIRSADDGNTWSTVSTDIRPFSMLRDRSGALMFFGYDTVNRTVLKRSLDSGATWTTTVLDINFRDRPMLAMERDMLFVRNGAIGRSVDRGTTWSVIDSGNAWWYATSNDRIVMASGNGFFRAASPAAIDVAPPSRAHRELTIESPTATDRVVVHTESARGTLRITDVQGRLLHTQDLDGASSHAIDVSRYSPGLYLVDVTTMTTYSTGRFIKAR